MRVARIEGIVGGEKSDAILVYKIASYIHVSILIRYVTFEVTTCVYPLWKGDIVLQQLLSNEQSENLLSSIEDLDPLIADDQNLHLTVEEKQEAEKEENEEERRTQYLQEQKERNKSAMSAANSMRNAGLPLMQMEPELNLADMVRLSQQNQSGSKEVQYSRKFAALQQGQQPIEQPPHIKLFNALLQRNHQQQHQHQLQHQHQHNNTNAI